MDKRFKTHIIWGSSPAPGDTANEYAFATEAELDAFLLGVSEAEGWLDYEITGPTATVNADGEIVEETECVLTMTSGAYGEETFPYDSYDEAVEGYERLLAKILSLSDGIPRQFKLETASGADLTHLLGRVPGFIPGYRLTNDTASFRHEGAVFDTEAEARAVKKWTEVVAYCLPSPKGPAMWDILFLCQP